MGISERAKLRYETIRGIKSNLVLVITGIILILLAPIWNLAIAPIIKIVPTDFDLIHQYNGNLRIYANPPGDPVIGQTPRDMEVIVEYFILSRPDLSTPGTSVVEAETRILDRSNGDVLYDSEKDFGVNRRTGELTDYDKSGNKEEGYLIVFPFDTPQTPVPVWLETAGTATDAVFIKTTKQLDLPVYEFNLEFKGLPVSAPTGFPSEYTGGELKSSLSRPDLDIGDEAILTAEYIADGSNTFLVEPLMGNMAGMTSGKLDTLLRVNHPETGFKGTFPLSEMEFSENKDSIERSVTFARDEVAKRKLQFVYIPVLLLVLGAAVLVIGLFAGVKTKKDGEED